ncbi:expressed unknown protein [Seminavis robusta]|uniref:Uncharacterized protein n=1 Tax=Seminavis robusta TaxID=568900 RepID=A0A9N8DN85_9STRA|nr:expressed unknown protein [Seminavis robusta]|eukprot:Sro173_g076430.1 n/a (285) ;mRNA; f:76537-77490
MTSLLLRSTLLLLACSSVSASPTGASACPGGEAAVGSTHITAADLKNGTLEESPQGLKVQLNGADLVPGTPGIFNAGEEAEIALVGTADFKGFLFRFDAELLSDVLISFGTPEAETAEIQPASVCTGRPSGMTHTNNNPKSTTTFTVEVEAPVPDMTLDVTVVIVNSAGVSEYYYTEYMLSADAAPEGDDGDAAGDANATAPEEPMESEPAPADGNGTTAAPDSSSTTAPDSSSTTAPDSPGTTAPDSSATSIVTTGWVTTFIGGLFAMVIIPSLSPVKFSMVV